MPNFNKVFLMGNLTRDPELRYTPQGTAVTNLRMAINRRFRNKVGEQKDEVCFLTVVVWDKQAELCNQYLHKGSPLFVEGRLQSRSWQDNAGNKRNVLEVRAERIQFLGTKPTEVDEQVVSKGDSGTPDEELPPLPLEEGSWSEQSRSRTNDNA